MVKNVFLVVGVLVFFLLTLVIAAMLLMPAAKQVLNNAAAISPVVSHLSIFISLIPSLLVANRFLNFKGKIKSYICWDFRYYVAALAGVVVLFAIVTAVNHMLGVKNSWVEDLMKGDHLTLAIIYFTILVLAPINEEIIFRGAALRIGSAISESRISVCLTVLISCGGFALLHTQYGYTTVIYLFFLAVWFAIVRIKSKSLSVPIIAHSLASLLGSLNL